MNLNFKNFHEAAKYFSNEDVCRDTLANMRWADGKVVCPKCGIAGAYTYANCVWYKCRDQKCKNRFSVTVGTFCENTKLPLSKWFMGIWLITAHKKGISSCQLARDLGIGQKAAWFMLHRVREMMRTSIGKKLRGTVEADETYVGGSISNKHKSARKKFVEDGSNWQENKTAVLGLQKRGGDAALTVVNIDPQAQIIDFIINSLAKKTKLMTDTHAYYEPLKVPFKHSTVNHSQNEFRRDDVYTNSVEGMFSHLKRMILGIYHQISKKHTQRYLDEFICRWNSKKTMDNERFKLVFTNMERRLTYANLIENKVVVINGEIVDTTVMTERKPRRVFQVHEDVVVGEFKSINEAIRQTGISNIHKALKGKRRSAGGFKWVYA